MSSDPQLTIPEWRLTDRLRKAREQRGLGMKEVAEYLGTSPSLVSMFERGARVPRDAYVRSWAELCGVPFEWLRYGVEGASLRSRCSHLFLVTDGTHQRISERRRYRESLKYEGVVYADLTHAA